MPFGSFFFPLFNSPNPPNLIVIGGGGFSVGGLFGGCLVGGLFGGCLVGGFFGGLFDVFNIQC